MADAACNFFERNKITSEKAKTQLINVLLFRLLFPTGGAAASVFSPVRASRS